MPEPVDIRFDEPCRIEHMVAEAPSGSRTRGMTVGVRVDQHVDAVVLDGARATDDGDFDIHDAPRLVIPLAHLPEFILALVGFLPPGSLAGMAAAAEARGRIEGAEVDRG